MNLQNAKMKRCEGGFIALISVVIISAILLLVSATLSFGGFYNRFSVLDSEFKKKSHSLAEACAEHALLKLVLNENYSGNEIIFVDGNSCEILPSPNPTGNPRNFDIKAVYKNSRTNLKISADFSSGKITSWMEVPNF